MKQAVMTLALFALSAGSPLAAQWAGMPTWNDPKGGTGLMIAGDWGRPGADAGKGNAFGARGSLGIGTVTLTAGVVSYKPEGFGATTSYGGQLALRLIGGSLVPLAVNLQFGAAGAGSYGSSGSGTYANASTTLLGAVGISVPLPTPGISIEPFFSPGVRYHRFAGVGTSPDVNETKFGYVLGANLGLGLLGIHFAYDYQKTSGGHAGIFGLGAHMAFRPTLGL